MHFCTRCTKCTRIEKPANQREQTKLPAGGVVSALQMRACVRATPHLNNCAKSGWRSRAWHSKMCRGAWRLAAVCAVVNAATLNDACHGDGARARARAVCVRVRVRVRVLMEYAPHVCEQ